MNSPETNPWNEVLGPFYAETGLQKHGIDDIDDLIGLQWDGIILYPHAQFDIQPNQALQRREKVLELWNTLIHPAINEGVIDEWTATGLLLQGTVERPSKAELISKDEAQATRVAMQISRAIARFRQ